MVYAFEITDKSVIEVKEDPKENVKTVVKVPGYYYEWHRKKNKSDIIVTKKPSRLHKAVFNGLEFVEWEVDREKWLDAIIRPKRNDLLDDVDLRRLNADKIETIAISKKVAWRTYKQALRNLPETINYENPEWPIAPNEE